MSLKNFGGFLLHGCLSCLTSTAGSAAIGFTATTGITPILFGLANALTSNIASEHFGELVSFNKLKDRIRQNDPEKLNHDLERLFKEAAVISITFIKKLFLAEIKKDENLLFNMHASERRNIIDQAEKFLSSNEKEIKRYIADEPIEKLQVKEPKEILDYLINYLIGVSIVELEENIKHRLRDFYVSKLPYCFELAFKEALKNDDHGFKAFQIWVLEETRNETLQIAESNKRIEEAINKLRSGHHVITKQELENITNDLSQKILNILEQDFINIKSLLEQLTIYIQNHFQAEFSLLNDILTIVKEIRDNQQLKIEQHLTARPFFPQLFLGRNEELETVKEKLFSGDNMLLLVNGEGGIGKTSLASKYYHTYENLYKHLAWVLSEKSIANALLLLAIPLNLRFEDSQSVEERLSLLLAKIASLGKPCLLVIDNANELNDLEENYLALRRCTNFHVLLTTRITQFAQAASYEIEGLPEEEALQLFKKHYPKHLPNEDDLFKKIRTAVGGNTLVIELLAKNLKQFNKLKINYTLLNLWEDLQQQGLLGLSKTTEVGEIDYQARGVMRKEKPESIIAAMYDLNDLLQAEIDFLSIFSVLPAESILYNTLQIIIGDIENLDETLLALAQKGWLDYNEEDSSFKISPVIQEIVRKKNTELLKSCSTPIYRLIDLLDYEPGTGHFINCNYKEALLYARYSTSVIFVLDFTDNVIAVLCERLGNYYNTTGNLQQALRYYQQYNDLEKELYEAYPENVSFKNGLAISYSKLGTTQADLGNLQQALKYYQQYNDLEKELYEAYPENVSFKNGLAISYSKLGTTQADLGNLQQALKYYQQYNDLEKELYEAYPENVSFKNGLAISYEKLGETQADLGNLQQALKYYQQYNDLKKELYEAYPENVSFKNGLAISYSKLGWLYKYKLDDSVNAKQYFRKAKEIWEELVASFPDYPEFSKNLSWVKKQLED